MPGSNQPRTRCPRLSALLLIAALPAVTPSGFAQGCVAVRGTGLADSALPADSELTSGNWLISIADRYLHSSRHFVGDREQLQRQTGANQVINHQDFLDLDAQYAITPRFLVGVTLPSEFSDRSQLSPATASTPSFRFHTQSAGIGDMRLTGYAWLWDTMSHPKGNIQFGLGLKMPTGDDGVTDQFFAKSGTGVVPVDHPVDQSIQPGDGGWGFTLELDAYREVLPRTVAFLQGFYLVNPMNQNDTLTWRDNSSTVPGAVTATTASASFYEHFMSIPDQYFARAGASYTLVPKWGLSANVAGRIEGIPVHDLIGGSDGFRRPGFIVSVEPGIEIMKGRYTFNLSLPWALYRNRERSVADQMAAAVSGKDIHGDAAFADYVVTASLAIRF